MIQLIGASLFTALPCFTPALAGGFDLFDRTWIEQCADRSAEHELIRTEQGPLDYLDYDRELNDRGTP